MSARADVAVLAPGGGTRAGARVQPVSRDRPLLRLGTFAALALYGTLRWGTLLSPAPTWRLLGLFGLSVALAGAGMLLAERSRVIVVVLAVVTILAALALAGVPAAWITHVRIAVTARGIGQGLTGLPRALLPYLGANQWIRTVILLGAAVLLLDSALIVGLGPRRPSETRRAAAAIGLIGLAIVPSTLMRPALPYLQGLLLFALLAAFLWADRIREHDLMAASTVAALAGVAAMFAAPALDSHTPWLNYQQLASNLAPKHPELFNWNQGYGPLQWPHSGRDVLEVQARQPQYWKAEDLAGFNGRGWTSINVPAPDPENTISRAALREWTETLHVTIHSMSSTDVIAAGTAAQPADLPGVSTGTNYGTWTDPSGLGAGDSYDITAYDPAPSPAQLTAAGDGYPAMIRSVYLTITVPLPDPAGSGSAPTGPLVGVPGLLQNSPASDQPVSFPPFRSQTAVDYGPALAASPYGRAYQLARRLLRRAATPYAYVMAVKGYLDSGRYIYDISPKPSNYPIETFLFGDRRGYCQQFAGAMALLLRMGGVPARVAVGFTSGHYDAGSHSWVVTDVDAHAWVEVWFPGYGWVRFDPTPPAPNGLLLLPTPKGAGSNAGGGGAHGSSASTAAGLAATTHAHRGGGIGALPILAVVAAVALLLGVGIVVRFGEATGEELLAELERAFARSGRRLEPGTTLAGLEQRFDASAAARDYVRTLRLSRFAGQDALPTGTQRRALRRQLRRGFAVVGTVRAIWALPPRLHLRLPVSGGPTRGIHST